MSFMSSLKTGTPRRSVAVDKLSKSFSMRSVVLSVPRVLLRQCLANSSFVMAFFAALSDGLTMPALTSSLFLSVIKRSKSSASYSKMLFNNFPMNVPYRGCDSLVETQGSLRIKCHISKHVRQTTWRKEH